MRSLVCLIFFLIIQTALQGQVKIGERVQLKHTNLTPLKNAVIDTSKIIVLDFWATWCAPCIASFPHLDSLQESFKKNVQIVALSDESVIKVSRFLEKRKFSFDFFIDQKKALFKLFDIESRPLTAVLHPDGTLLWVGHSGELGSILNNVINQKKIVTNSLKTIDYSYQKYYSSIQIDEREKSLYTYQISKSRETDKYEAKTQKGALADSAINIYYRAVSISEIIQDLLGASDLQVINNRIDLDTILINITAKSALKSISYRKEKEKIVSDLQGIFRFNVKREYKTVDAYLLKIENSEMLSKVIEQLPGGGMVQSINNNYKVIRLSLSELAEFFEKKLKIFITYEGDKTKKFNLEFKKFRSIEELNKELIEKYGLTLEPTIISTQIIEIN